MDGDGGDGSESVRVLIGHSLGEMATGWHPTTTGTLLRVVDDDF